MPEKLTNISLFTGAGGLDIGLAKAGFETKVCVESDSNCHATLEANRSYFSDPSFRLFGDIKDLSPGQVLEELDMTPGDLTLISGGPPCQSYSTAGKRQAIVDPRGNLVFKFADWIKTAQPRFFLMENVRGLLSAAIRHRPLHLRHGSSPNLEEDEELGSVFRQVILPLFEDELGYKVSYGILNALDYGVAQDRKRLIIIGSRDHSLIESKNGRCPIDFIVPPTHGNHPLEPRMTLLDALQDLHDTTPEYQKYSQARAEIFDLLEPGENWRALRDNENYGDEFVRQIMGGAYNSTGGRVGFWRRLSWNKWSPTLTTSPTQKSTGLCHPDEVRPLSVREYARIQGFPDYWNFQGSTAAKYKQIGNAVPTELARQLGIALERLSGISTDEPVPVDVLAG